MKRASTTILFSLLLACATPLWGQQLQAAKAFPSAPDKAVGVVLTDSAGGWLVFAVPSMVPVTAEPINSGCGIVWEGSPGRYLVLYFPAGQSFPQPEVTLRDLGIAGPVTPPDVPDVPTDPTRPPLTTKPTAAVYVYEKDQSSIPRPVQASLQAINAAGLVAASEFEKDTVDGDGQVPDQYKQALDAAVKAGLPCLVVLAGDRVLRTVRDPKTEAAVTEAVK